MPGLYIVKDENNNILEWFDSEDSAYEWYNSYAIPGSYVEFEEDLS